MEHNEDKGVLGDELCSRLLLVHVLLGCDTHNLNSFWYRQTSSPETCPKHIEFQQYADLFNEEKVAKKYVIDAGVGALVSIHNGTKDEGIDVL